MNVTNALEIALNHLDCLTAGQHPFIKEGRRSLMKNEVSEIKIDLARAVTEKNWMERTLPPQIESERKANEQLTAENEALTTERDELRSRNEVLESEHVEFYEKWHECRRKLEAMQAKREPLSSELLTELAQQANKAINPYYEFARAIEAAHGITGGEK